MYSLVLLISLTAVIHGQHQFNGDVSLAKILSDRRKQSVTGDFGVSFQQEDGTDFNEVADVDGYRVGQYSYIDSNGEKKTVKYEAGPGIGFRIISADNIPQAVQLPAQHQQIQQRLSAQHQRIEQERAHLAVEPQPAPQPQPQAQPQQFSPPQPFSFTVETGANVGRRPQPEQFRQQPKPQQFRPQQFRPQPQPQPVRVQPARPQPQQPIQAQAPIFRTTTTTHAPRFFPPGELSLTRNEKGYVYSFSS